MSRIPGRAETDEEKRVVLAKLLEVWKRRPHARLGQLLLSYVPVTVPEAGGLQRALFYIEDEALVDGVKTKIEEEDSR